MSKIRYQVFAGETDEAMEYVGTWDSKPSANAVSRIELHHLRAKGFKRARSEVRIHPDDLPASDYSYTYPESVARAGEPAMSLYRELERLATRVDGAEGVRADGSNPDTRTARMLLESLADYVENDQC